MSKQVGMVEISKCILSKLWYTSLVVHRENDTNRFLSCQSDTVNFVESEISITNLIQFKKDSQHQWIIQILLQKLIDNVAPGIKDMKKQHSYAEMIHALELCKNLTIHLQQELLMLHENDSQEISNKIYEEWYIFVKENIYNIPNILCWIINELSVACSDTSTVTINALRNIYFSLAKELLECNNQHLINDNSLGCALCIISKICITKSDIIELSRWLFPIILKAHNIQDIELVLFSRTDRKLFNTWCTFLNEVHAYSKITDDLNDALNIEKILFDYASMSAPLINKNSLIKRVTKTKLHWVLDTLDSCYILMIKEKYNNVTSMLSCELLKTFWPVVLFKVLNDCTTEETFSTKSEEIDGFVYNSIKFLISKYDFEHDLALQKLSILLKKYVKIMEYILHQIEERDKINDSKREIIQETNKSIGPFQQRISMKYIFNLLQRSSCLSVLKMTTNLHEQDYIEIKNLLKDCHESENIFYAYYSIISALKAVLSSATYNTNKSIIASHFFDMKHYLQILYPLNLRMEVVENIFSLLFLQHEDFDHIQKSYDKYSPSILDEQSRFENKWIEQHLMGFICNKYIIRDMLLYLKEIVSITEDEYAKMKSENGCTEKLNEIKESISSINVAIADAKWRLELYTNSQFTEDSSTSKDIDKRFVTKSKTLLDGTLISNRFKENVLFYQGGNTSDETKIKSDSSSETDFMHNTKWRKRPKNIALTADSATKDIMHKPLFVNFLLASKESLIIQCLWKKDYAKAQDIIETSAMKSTQLNGEIQFSKALLAFREDVRKQGNALKDENQFTENLQSSTLENLRLVTQGGIQSSRQTSKFETFLASQEANLRMLSMDVINRNEIVTICALDLALTISQDHSASNNLCEVAMKHLKLCKTFDNTEYAHFFVKIYQLLYERKDMISVENILCDAKISLSVKEYREKDDFWTDIMNKHNEFKESQANKNTINKILKDGNYLPGLKVLNKTATISSGTADKYMQNVYHHLQLLHTIIPTEQPILTVSDLLRIPLYHYFGYQIFELEIEPNKLESIAYNLQVNLLYGILRNACPKLFYEKNIVKCFTNNKNIGCFVLNKMPRKSDLSHKIQGPNQCVSEILEELLQVLQNLNLGESYLNHNIYKTISKHPDIQDILTKTSRLMSLDLSDLSMGDETLTFLLNTWNLMFIHAALTVWVNYPPLNDIQHAVSLTSIGYLIGDLGLVTLSALRSKLLNNITLDDTFFIQFEELNEPVWQDLDITHDPRVIFAMANEFYGTPCIRVCSAESLTEDLNNAFHGYLDYYTSKFEKSVRNTETQNTIVLPDIVKRYQDYVSQDYENNLNDNNSDNEFSIDNYFKLFNKRIIIQYTAPSYLYDIILKYSNHSNVNHSKQIDQHRSVLWKTHTVRSSLLQYLEGHCWIVSYLLQRIYNENPTILENNCDNLKCIASLENLLCASWATEMKLFFDNNQALAAILEMIPAQKLWSHFEIASKENQWCACLKLINALPDNLVINTELQCFKDKVLSCIVSKEDIPHTEILQYLYEIKDIYVLSQTVLYNINRWHADICENALLYAVHHVDSYKLPAHCKHQLNEVLHRVIIFHKMLPYRVTKPNGTWYDVAYCTAKIEPFQIVTSLINADKFELCLEWLESQAFSLEIHPSVTEDLLMGLLKKESQNFEQTLTFLQALPSNQSINLCKDVLKKLESTDSLEFICNYLLKHCKIAKTIKYRRILIGIDILRMLDVQERSSYVHLIKEPLLMLEQLLMNCKFENIKKILNRIQEKLEEVDISRHSFDNIIRFYAQRALDFRVSLQCDNVESKSKNVQHSTSEAESTEFVMPILVPTKSEWVPNDKARECSCCKTVIFSMFNRRHHCRRCGRVICATCSQHRMQVSGYPPSVLVRVCDDCKRQTVLQMLAVQGTSITPSSEMFDYWRLTRDHKHNETIREEFSFEYAPNISLCLAILDLHSDHKTYTSFLLDRCDEMKRLLQPVSGEKVNPEIDHIVIIKMIRSLLIAAKVKCAKLGLNTGLAHCDRFLSQVDLIASLVQSDCLHLIPSDNLDEHTLRKLRDILIEKEQWTLALDVSTKAGLDTQGVWATWGKACLKMGYFDQARDKFFHCLDKIQHEDFDDWVILSHPKDPAIQNTRETRKSVTEICKIDEDKEIHVHDLSSKKTEFGKNRPLKDPPLLTEILQILDNLSTYKQYVPSYSHQYKSSVSQEILNSFGNLKVTNQGQFNIKNASSNAQSVYHQESFYYLLTYASYNSISEFLLRNEEFNECLTFTLENNLDPDLFFNSIYLYCLKNGSIDKLHEAMRNKDSSLLIWKRYLIYVCHSLEKRQYLNILYQLQLFMKDSIRAAMTCIRFYLNKISSYTDLCARGNLLLDAQKHLESELQIETLNQKRKKSTGSMHSNQGILTMEMEPSEIDKHINTICRQMEIAKFLANCEKEGRAPAQFLNLFPDKDCDRPYTLELPTLFGNQQQKIDLAVLAILCGRNIEEGFGIAFRIMQDYNLPQQRVYSLTGHILTLRNNVTAIEQLIKCCHTSGIPNSYIVSDYVLTHCIKLLFDPLHSESESVSKNDIHSLIRLITDTELKINAYIECKKLKTAYLLAVKHSRAQDIRKILKEADRLGQSAIKAICIKWLQQEPKV